MSAATGAAAITLSEFDIIKNDEIAALESIFEKDFTRERFGSVLFIGKQARMEEDWKVEPAQKSQPMFSIKVRPTLFQSSYVGHNQTQEVNIHQKFQQSNKPVKRSTSNSSSASSSSSSSSSAASLAIDDLLVEELITLHIMFRKEYPQKIPRIWIATTSESISRDELDALLEQLIELAKEKSKLKVACVFELVEHIRNFLLERRTKRHDKARAHMRAINAAKLQEEEGENLHELYERNEKERLEEQKRQQRLDSDEDDRKEKQAFVIDDDAVQEAIRKKDQAYASKLIKAGEKPQQANTNVHEETKPTTNVVDILHNVKNPLSRYENDFEEIEVLGVGGGGEVRRCRNRIDGMEYAIKRVKLGQNDQENRRMVKEASNLARVTHPHIIRYIQSWIEEERIDSSLEKIDEKGNDLTGESMSDEEDESEEEDEDENSDEEEEEEDSEEDDEEEEDDDFGFTFARPDKNVKMDDFEIDDDEEEEDDDILGGFHFQDPDEHHDGNQSDDAEEQAFGAIWSYHSSLGSNAREKRGLGDKNNSNKKKTNLQGSNKDHKSGRSKNKHDKLTGSSSTDTSEVSKTKRNSPRRYLYIQMEYAPGKTLREAIDGGDLYQDQEKSFKLLRQIVEALAYLHDTCHLIHRDIKPQNVFLDSEFNVKVGDFGLATVHKQQNSNREDVDEIGLPLPQSSTAAASDINQMVDRKIMLSRNSEVGSTRSVDITRGVGTTLYRAPEVSQKGVVYDQAADMWSLGITFFEMLHPPIATGMERIRTIMNIRENPRNLSKYSFLPPKAISILVDLLQHDPSKRPAAAQLLQSGRLPGKIESESKYFNEVLSVVATPNSTVYGRLIGSLFEQPPRPEIFSTYDHDPSTAFQTSNSRISQSRIPPRQVQLRATGYLNTFYLHNTQAKMRAITLIESISRQLLELYGFIELQTPLLLPKIQDNKGSDGSIGDIGSTPGQQPALFIDELGVVVQLPTSLALSFTRWLALHSDVLWLKRFEIGRIFNAAEAAGGQPKSRRLIEFDSVLPVTVGTPTLCTAFVEVILCSWKIVHECIKGNLARSTTQIFEKTRCFVEIGHALFQDSILRMIGIPKKNRVSVANMLTEIIASISVSSQLSGGKGWWNEAKRRMSMLTAQGTENPSLPPLLNQNQIELLRGFLHICLRVDATPHVKKQVKDKTAGNNPNRRKQTGFITNKSIDEDEDEVNENDEDDFDDFEKEKPLTAQTSNQTTGSSQVREAFLERIFQEFRDEVDKCAKKMKIEIENVNSFKKSNQYLTLSAPVIDQLRERILDSINECSLTVKHLSMSIGDDSLRFSPWGAKPNEFEKCYFKIIVLSRSLDPSKHVSAEKEMSRQMQMNLGYASIGSKMVKIGSMKRKNQAPLESFIASEGGRLDNILEFNSSRIRLQTTVHSSTPPPPGVNLGDSSGVQRAVISSKVSVDKLARFISFVARYLSPSPCSVLICAPSDDADFPPPQRAYLAEKIRAHNISCEWQHPWGLTSDAVLEYARLQGIPIVLSQTWNLGKVMYRVRTTALASIGASDTDDKATNIPSIMKRNLVSTPLHSGTQTQSSSATQTNPGAIPSGSGLANAPIAQAIAFDRKLDESELFTYLFRLLGL